MNTCRFFLLRFIFPILILATHTGIAQIADTAFVQPVSIQYQLGTKLSGHNLQKVVIDHNNRIYVLTDIGLGRLEGNTIIADQLYRPLAKRKPVDITIQENTGNLYYLYEDCFLSNTDAGKPFEFLAKGRFKHIAVAADSTVLLADDHALVRYTKGQPEQIDAPGGTILSIQPYKNRFYLLYADAVYQLKAHQLRLICKGVHLQAFSFRNKELLLGTAEGYYSIDLATGDTLLPLQTKIPIRNIRALMVVNGRIWAGTAHGAFTTNGAEGFRYYASRRWLNQDSIIAMTQDQAGNSYLLTPTGLNKIAQTRTTYLQKAEYFQRKVRARHIRYGLVAKIKMDRPGDLSSATMVDTDNDGLWTSFYLGSQAFRYAVTGSAEARRYCWETFTAYERLIAITSVKGFPARTFERTGYRFSGDASDWRPSPDSGWEWKGTTSSDEFVGYIFVAAMMNEFVAKTAAEKQRIAIFIDQILQHILDHNYNFVDADGRPTLWGRWNPDYINWYPKTLSDRKLGSTDLIAGLELGYALTGKARYKKEALALMNEQGYLENIMISPYQIKPTPGYIYKGHNMGEGGWNHSDDEMEFLSFWVLYHYAFDDSLREQFGRAIKAYWQIERPEKNPVWNLITYATEGSFDKEATLWYLREYPTDLIDWTMQNSIRKDLIYLPSNFRHQYTEQVLSPAERPIHHYNTNEFRLDGGDGGRTALSGAEYLLPYWMARYLKVIE